MSQKTLKKHMRKMLEEKYDEVIYAGGFVFAKGTVPILLVAHMDTVHKELPQIIELNNGNGESLYTRTDKVIKGTRKLEAELRDLMYSDNDAYMKRMGFPGGARVVGKDGRMEKI